MRAASMNTVEALKYIQSRLHPTIGGHSIGQSETILELILKCSRTALYLDNKIISSDLLSEIDSIIDRRLTGEPLQYILGKVFFYSREFTVSPEVLIPRPDTEILVEQVLLHEKKTNCCFADIGTGSGIIACILTESNPGWKGIGVDISYKSLLIARQNVQTGVNLLCSDLLKAIKMDKQFDFIVSNPPYISESELETLEPQVKDFEPRRALSGGKDGLDFYRYLANDTKYWIKPGGYIYCEIGYNQEYEVMELFSINDWEDISSVKDLGGNSRVIRAKKKVYSS